MVSILYLNEIQNKFSSDLIEIHWDEFWVYWLVYEFRIQVEEEGKKNYIFLYLVVQERVQNGQLSIEHIGTNSMIADPLTKAVSAIVFREHTAYMGLNDGIWGR